MQITTFQIKYADDDDDDFDLQHSLIDVIPHVASVSLCKYTNIIFCQNILIYWTYILTTTVLNLRPEFLSRDISVQMSLFCL